ncbi:hypothetical protein V6N12_012171 [Hibiscus sabdariffa]|uniref:Uncharacterized protein n=1 Tax=Hibiscus sabdariffa TaxID=183260 RepID=A0ABR2CJD8_9ROSI
MMSFSLLNEAQSSWLLDQLSPPSTHNPKHPSTMAPPQAPPSTTKLAVTWACIGLPMTAPMPPVLWPTTILLQSSQQVPDGEIREMGYTLKLHTDLHEVQTMSGKELKVKCKFIHDIRREEARNVTCKLFRVHIVPQ